MDAPRTAVSVEAVLSILRHADFVRARIAALSEERRVSDEKTLAERIQVAERDLMLLKEPIDHVVFGAV